MSTEELRQVREKQAKEEIEKLIESGIPIVKLNIFDGLDSLEISSKVKSQVEYTQELYINLVEQLQSLNKNMRHKYLDTAKKADIIDNQIVEKENSFLIALYSSFKNKTAIDYLIENYGNCLTKEQIVQIHDTLLKGTSSENKTGIREDDFKFVGTWNNGERQVQYFPVLAKHIDQALDRFVSYYNANINKLDNDYDVLVRPIIYHGLIATLQMFRDGNTRFARILQHTEMWGLFNNSIDHKLELPIIYATRQYYAYRNQYRDLIMNIAKNNSNDSWNEWILFNLKRIQDNIYNNENNIKLLKFK